MKSAKRILFFSILVNSLCGCMTVRFEGYSQFRNISDETVNRYRIMLLEINMAPLEKNFTPATPRPRLVGALPEEDINAWAVRLMPKVFSTDGNAIPIRITVDNPVNNHDLDHISKVILSGLLPHSYYSESTCKVDVEAFGVCKETEISLISAIDQFSIISSGRPIFKESIATFEKTGFAMKANAVTENAVEVFARTIVPAVAAILKQNEQSGIYFKARNDLKPDVNKAEEFRLLLEKGLIDKPEYERSIIRYAELYDPSRVAVEFKMLCENGVISFDEYKNEVIKCFNAELEKSHVYE